MTDTRQPERELVVVRHGRAHCNDTGTIAGPACTGLTDTGRAQATATAHHLRRDGTVTAIHASTTPRALETAELIANTLGLTVTAEPGLRVPDPGAAEGQQWATARAAWQPDARNPTRPTAPGAETWHAYLDRATVTLAGLLDQHANGTLLIVGHTETLTAILYLLLDTTTLGQLKVAFDHCAITRLHATVEWPGVDVFHQRWSLVQHNDTGHLRDAAHELTASPSAPQRCSSSP